MEFEDHYPLNARYLDVLTNEEQPAFEYIINCSLLTSITFRTQLSRYEQNEHVRQIQTLMLDRIDWCCEFAEQSKFDSDARLPLHYYHRSIVNLGLGNVGPELNDLAAMISYCCDHRSLLSLEIVAKVFLHAIHKIYQRAPKAFRTSQLLSRARDICHIIMKEEQGVSSEDNTKTDAEEQQKNKSHLIPNLQNIESRVVSMSGIFHKRLGERSKAFELWRKSIESSKRVINSITSQKELYLSAISLDDAQDTAVSSSSEEQEESTSDTATTTSSAATPLSKEASLMVEFTKCLLNTKLTQMRAIYNIAANTKTMQDIEETLRTIDEGFQFYQTMAAVSSGLASPAPPPQLPDPSNKTANLVELFQYRTWTLYLKVLELKMQKKDQMALLQARDLLNYSISINKLLKLDTTNREKTLVTIEKSLSDLANPPAPKVTPSKSSALAPAPAQSSSKPAPPNLATTPAKTSPATTAAASKQPTPSAQVGLMIIALLISSSDFLSSFHPPQKTAAKAPATTAATSTNSNANPPQKTATNAAASPTVVVQSTAKAVAPVPVQWMPDEAVTACCVCSTAFSFFNRRHHCRACGRVVCDPCSPKVVMPDFLGVCTPERVCTPCYRLRTPPTVTASSSSSSDSTPSSGPPTK